MNKKATTIGTTLTWAVGMFIIAFILVLYIIASYLLFTSYRAQGFLLSLNPFSGGDENKFEYSLLPGNLELVEGSLSFLNLNKNLIYNYDVSSNALENNFKIHFNDMQHCSFFKENKIINGYGLELFEGYDFSQVNGNEKYSLLGKSKKVISSSAYDYPDNPFEPFYDLFWTGISMPNRQSTYILFNQDKTPMIARFYRGEASIKQFSQLDLTKFDNCNDEV